MTDHLGNNRLLYQASWDTDNNVVKKELKGTYDYYPYGKILRKYVPGGGIKRHLSIQHKRDHETITENNDGVGLNNRGGGLLSLDSLAVKFRNENPAGNNSIIYIDSDGKERIVVTGGEFDGERYKYNFVEPSIKQLREYIDTVGSNLVVWVVMNVGYSDFEIEKFQLIAKDLGVDFQLIGSAEEFTNYLNSKNIALSVLGKERIESQIGGMSIFGHGYVGSAEFAHGQDDKEKFSWGISDVTKLKAGAFSTNSMTCFYTCNAASGNEGKDFSNSLIRQFFKSTNSRVSGYWGRTDYAKMNKGEGSSDKRSRFLNGFNAKGSQNLPEAGTKESGESSTIVILGN